MKYTEKAFIYSLLRKIPSPYNRSIVAECVNKLEWNELEDYDRPFVYCTASYVGLKHVPHPLHGLLLLLLFIYFIKGGDCLDWIRYLHPRRYQLLSDHDRIASSKSLDHLYSTRGLITCHTADGNPSSSFFFFFLPILCCLARRGRDPYLLHAGVKIGLKSQSYFNFWRPTSSSMHVQRTKKTLDNPKEV